MTERIGFFDEDLHHLSMARLCAFLCIGAASGIGASVAIAILWVTFKGAVPDGLTELVLGAGGVVGGLVGGAWAALRERTKTGEEVQPQVILNQPNVVQP